MPQFLESFRKLALNVPNIGLCKKSMLWGFQEILNRFQLLLSLFVLWSVLKAFELYACGLFWWRFSFSSDIVLCYWESAELCAILRNFEKMCIFFDWQVLFYSLPFHFIPISGNKYLSFSELKHFLERHAIDLFFNLKNLCP